MQGKIALLGATLIGAYLVGSISTGIGLARARGVDLRAAGSGNVGATNAARVLGRRLGLVVFAGDALKGLLPTLLVRLYAGPNSRAAWAAQAVAVAVVAGHIWPIWHGFRGGKGVATAAGAFLALAPLATLGSGLIWLALFLSFRIASVASVVAAAALPILLFASGAQRPLLVAAGTILTLVIARHRANLARLVRREEPPLRAPARVQPTGCSAEDRPPGGPPETP